MDPRAPNRESAVLILCVCQSPSYPPRISHPTHHSVWGFIHSFRKQLTEHLLWVRRWVGHGGQHGQNQTWSLPQGAPVPWGLRTSTDNHHIILF